MTHEKLNAELINLGCTLPRSEDFEVFSRKITSGGVTFENPFCVLPMEGGDFNIDDSAPSELSERRYLRYAAGGASLVWFEATAVQPDARSFDRQSMLTENNVGKFRALLDKMRAINPELKIVVQLTHSGRFCKKVHSPAPIISHHSEPLNDRMRLDPDYPVATDEYLDALPDAFAHSAKLAVEAGFDGIDVKCCHLYLYSELLAAYSRPGKYGGCFENRARLYLDTVDAVRAAVPSSVFVTTRLGMSDMIPYPWGFAMKTDGSMEYDLSETFALISELKSRGVGIICLTMGTPYYNPHVNRPYGRGVPASPEEPLKGVERIIYTAAEVKRRFPDMTFIGAGYSYLGEASAEVAAGALKDGMIDMVGFGRMSLCYPDFARDMLAGRFDRRRACMTCGKCSEFLRNFCEVGCPIRDSELYMPKYLTMQEALKTK